MGKNDTWWYPRAFIHRGVDCQSWSTFSNFKQNQLFKKLRSEPGVPDYTPSVHCVHFFRKQKSSLSWNIGRDVCLPYYCWTVRLFQTHFQNPNIGIGTIFIRPEVPNYYYLRHDLKVTSSYPTLAALHTPLPPTQHQVQSNCSFPIPPPYLWLIDWSIDCWTCSSLHLEFLLSNQLLNIADEESYIKCLPWMKPRAVTWLLSSMWPPLNSLHNTFHSQKCPCY